VKCQWKADWALRWVALGVDYEMAGKDLIDSVTLSSRICRAIGGSPPDGFNYELFLDEAGGKISKSKGNGLTIDQWLRYASPESLSLFMFGKPRAAKRLYFDVIPRAVDDYYGFLEAYGARTRQTAWRTRCGMSTRESRRMCRSRFPSPCCSTWRAPPTPRIGYPLGLCFAAPAGRHAANGTGARSPRRLRRALLPRFREARKTLPSPDEVERQALWRSMRRCPPCRPMRARKRSRMPIYDVGRRFERFQTPEKPGADGRPGVALRWFSTLYELLLGQEKGPRFGSFVAIYGIEETRALIGAALSGASEPSTRREAGEELAAASSG
jgi:lysyl-tRNA synthetase class 1